MKECKLYKKMDERVRCLACAHKCLIGKEQTGICGVRKNINGKLYLLVYGKVVSMNVDPIEKKPLYHFLPKTESFSVGTVGCNLGCSFCQNFDISQMSKDEFGRKILGREIGPEEIVKEAVRSGCKSVAYTYNEPVIWCEGVKEIAELAHKNGLKNVMVTNGYWSKESFEFLKDCIDAVNIDLKSISEEFYESLCRARLQPVKDTIERCVKAGMHVEVTTLLIPGENDSEKELERIARFLADLDKNIVWHISRFFPMYKMQDKRVTPMSSLEKAYKIGRKYLKHVYLGNV
jgi:pyruvate formate lyase activating enzyme